MTLLIRVIIFSAELNNDYLQDSLKTFNPDQLYLRIAAGEIDICLVVGGGYWVLTPIRICLVADVR